MRLQLSSTMMIAICLLFTSSCASRRDQPPRRDGYVVHAYHFCDKCDSLQGGIYEKGPFERFAGPNKDNCEHEWQEITRERFKQLATDKYNVDWDQETAHFWIYDNKPDAADETHVAIEDPVKD